MNPTAQPSANPSANPSENATEQAKADAAPGSADTAGADNNPAMQGEGNYTAARRHRESVEAFIDAGKVAPAADKAAPANAAEAQALKDAEAQGRKHAKG